MAERLSNRKSSCHPNRIVLLGIFIFRISTFCQSLDNHTGLGFLFYVTMVLLSELSHYLGCMQDRLCKGYVKEKCFHSQGRQRSIKIVRQFKSDCLPCNRGKLFICTCWQTGRTQVLPGTVNAIKLITSPAKGNNSKEEENRGRYLFTLQAGKQGFGREHFIYLMCLYTAQ